MSTLQVIDVHTHVVPEFFPPYLGSRIGVPWPAMAHDGCGHARLLISGIKYSDIAESAWDMTRRAEEMTKLSVARQVLSPLPELLSPWLPAEDAQVLLRYVNEQIAGMVASDPRRFIGIGAVPLQDLDLALREMEFVMGPLALAGVEIPPNVGGVPIGDARFKPFFAAAESMGAAVFVHALRAVGTERLIGPPFLENIIGYPCETAFAIASMITGGTLEAHPNLRIAFSHGGGAFGLVLPRLQGSWSSTPRVKELIPESPEKTARRLYYDTVVYDPRVVRYLAEVFGDSRLLIGTDYPFGSYPAPLALMSGTGFSEAVQKRICEENPRRYLGLQVPLDPIG